MGIEHLDWEPSDPELRAGLESMAPHPEGGEEDKYDVSARIIGWYGINASANVSNQLEKRINGWYGTYNKSNLLKSRISRYGYGIDLSSGGTPLFGEELEP